jgi:hypothetical protein
MEYMALVKDPVLKPLWKRGFENDVGRLFKGIHGIQQKTLVYLLISETSPVTDK